MDIKAIRTCVKDIRLTLEVLEGYLVDEPEPPHPPDNLTEAVFVMNPTKKYFPKDDVGDCYARGIRDMQVWQDRCYLAYGDQYADRGPITILSFGKDMDIKEESTVPEEQLTEFIVTENCLYTYGADKVHGAEDDDGAIYVRDMDGEWMEYSTVRGALHMNSFAFFDHKYFAIGSWRSGTKVVWSSDLENWKTLLPISEDVQYQKVAACEDCLFIFANEKATKKAFLYKVRKGNPKAERIDMEPYPGLESYYNWPERIVSAEPGIIYTSVTGFGTASPQSKKLYYASNAVDPTLAFESDWFIRDVLPTHVLTVANNVPPFLTRIHELEEWKIIGEFTMPAMPNSFELFNGKFYVGCCSRRNEADEDSGGIFLIQ